MRTTDELLDETTEKLATMRVVVDGEDYTITGVDNPKRLLDASDLTLLDGFAPAKDAVAFDFGTYVTILQATGLDMRLGDYWSSSLHLDTKGQVIFTKLAPVPEPATGTLGLLALAAFAARRRRK